MNGTVADLERLNELRRQREAIAGHLAWLDREIARVSAQRDAPATVSAKAPNAPPPNSLPSLPSVAVDRPKPVALPTHLTSARSADDIFEEIAGENPAEKPPVSKTGCWIVFLAVSIVGFGGAVFAIYAYYG